MTGGFHRALIRVRGRDQIERGCRTHNTAGIELLLADDSAQLRLQLKEVAQVNRDMQLFETAPRLASFPT